MAIARLRCEAPHAVLGLSGASWHKRLEVDVIAYRSAVVEGAADVERTMRNMREDGMGMDGVLAFLAKQRMRV